MHIWKGCYHFNNKLAGVPQLSVFSHCVDFLSLENQFYNLSLIPNLHKWPWYNDKDKKKLEVKFEKRFLTSCAHYPYLPGNRILLESNLSGWHSLLKVPWTSILIKSLVLSCRVVFVFILHKDRLSTFFIFKVVWVCLNYICLLIYCSFFRVKMYPCFS